MDNEPREEAAFTEHDRAVLLDLAGAVSMVLLEKEEVHTSSNHMVATMMVDMMQVCMCECECGLCLIRRANPYHIILIT